MKLTLALLACLAVGCLATGIHSPDQKVKIADKQFLEMQKFLFELVYRVEEPLMIENYIKRGDKFVMDKSQYTEFTMYMEKFYEAYKMGVLLPKGEFFGALVKTHAKQAMGLFNFLYYAKSWETFMQNAIWARMHVNEGMFVYALTMTVIHRDDFHGLMLPAIYEIFPQHFFNSKFVVEAEKFDFDVWNKLIMYEKEFNDVYYMENNMPNKFGDDYMYMKDWKMWQWWKLMGLGEHWYAEEKYMLRENIYEYNQDTKWESMLEHVKMFYMPVDYSRDIEIYNEHSKMSYFTEDLGWNAYWYYLNMDYSNTLDGEAFGLDKDRRGEFWVHNVQQLLARYYMERLSNGLGDIPQFSWFAQIEQGYEPELIAYNGVGFSMRQNYWEFKTYGNFEMLHKVASALQRIYNIVDTGIYKTHDGHMIDMRKPEAIEYIGNMLQGNVDALDIYFYRSWYMLAHMVFGNVNVDDMEVQPNVMLNYETMMRDPLFYMFYKVIARTYYRFMDQMPKYTQEQLMMQGVNVKHVDVSQLVTYYDLVDTDVTNLLNDKMVFHDGQLVWDKSIFARQMRLNHKPFTYVLNIESDKPQKVVIRTFLAPKFDELGQMISLADNRENFMELDEFTYDLNAGSNVVKRNSNDFYWTIKDRTTYTELYQYVMMAYDGKYDLPLDISEPHCGFPDRLLLPKGRNKGMPMQLFFMVMPYHAPAQNAQFANFDYTYSCGIGSGARYIDSMPLGYPFDRPIDEYEFFVPNMYFKDVEIFHMNTFERYTKQEYKNLGQFDYDFFLNYYTKSMN